MASAATPTSDRYELAELRGEGVIGSAAVWTTSAPNRVGELGYTIRRDCWGRGYASEVVPRLLTLGFENLDLERLAATCDPGNAASVRVLEKTGFKREGLLRGLIVVRGRRQDRLIFGCLNTDVTETGAQSQGNGHRSVDQQQARH